MIPPSAMVPTTASGHGRPDFDSRNALVNAPTPTKAWWPSETWPA